ncbi:hypothetical protein [Sorangium cellulosum]|uniref:Ferritin-like diiron domain-containing protein n=1 Tax=Sorangium cellulosum TaxID=56 RepID=A0A150QU60_SORCE|nr:hypothetical protein [Sorangium cellulosum]KYF71108.1 hypothetical protein BE15_37565 [Sorangium cellulosum]
MANEQKQGAGTQGQQGRSESSVVPDKDYNLVSVLYHALQGAETYAQYVQDAQKQGDQELATFFGEVRQEELRLAERAKHLLGQRLSGGRPQGGTRGSA